MYFAKCGYTPDLTIERDSNSGQSPSCMPRQIGISSTSTSKLPRVRCPFSVVLRSTCGHQTLGSPTVSHGEEDLIRHLYQKARAGTTRPRSAFYEIEIERPDDLPLFRPRIAFKDVTSPTNSRSVIACLVPPMVALVHTAPTLLRRSGDEADEAYLLGFLSSIPFDWYARRWVELHLSFSLLASMPVPRPARTNPVRQRLTELSARLAAVDSRFDDWAQALGVSPGSLQSDPERLEALAEIDALAAVLYGLSEANLEYVSSRTFTEDGTIGLVSRFAKAHFGHWRSEE